MVIGVIGVIRVIGVIGVIRVIRVIRVIGYRIITIVFGCTQCGGDVINSLGKTCPRLDLPDLKR